MGKRLGRAARVRRSPNDETGRILPAMTRRTKTGLWIGLIACLAGCGGSRPEPADASNAAGDESAKPAASDDGDNAEKANKEDDESSGSSKDDAKKSDDAKKDEDSKKDDAGGPTFPENATVAQAIAAIPKGTQRSNIDPETLGEPLNKAEVYAPCKPGSQHFKLKVAVWDGKAVGIDVSSPNKALAECVKKQVREIEWHDKVKSLNTVEYSM